MPSIKIPNPLKSLNPLSAGVPAGRAVVAATAARTPTVAGIGAPRASASTGGVHITVNGAIDPVATARQIRRILSGDQRRLGLAT